MLLLSGAAFGSLPISRKHNSFGDIRVGNMLRVRGDSHTVIVLEKKSGSQFYVETRYPEGGT